MRRICIDYSPEITENVTKNVIFPLSFKKISTKRAVQKLQIKIQINMALTKEFDNFRITCIKVCCERNG